jgi:hypothetical protein
MLNVSNALHCQQTVFKMTGILYNYGAAWVGFTDMFPLTTAKDPLISRP